MPLVVATRAKQGERLTYGHLFNPAFAAEISLIDPLPHQRLAVYDHMVQQTRLRFLLADDAGAGKTIMTGQPMICKPTNVTGRQDLPLFYISYISLFLLLTAYFKNGSSKKSAQRGKSLFTSRTSQEGGPTYIANVMRNGIVLYEPGSLPTPFAA